MQLRPYQEDALRQVFEYAIEHPHGSVLLVIPPRGGKTPTAATMARIVMDEQGFHVLWIVHRIELLDHAVEHLVDCGIPREKIGVIAAERRANHDAPFQVASEATLDKRNKPRAELVIWDEAQHDAAPRRRRIRALYPEAFHLGITGTPERLGGGGLDRDYEHMIVAVQPSELIHDDYLAVPAIFAPERKFVPNMKAVRSVRGDYSIEDLELLMNRENMIRSLVSEWQRLAEGRRTIVFPVNIAHSQAIVSAFQAFGIRAAHLDGETPMKPRKKLLADLRNGAVQVLSSVGVVSEGIDLPEVKCVILARPTKSLPLFLQQSARCMTPWIRRTSARILDAAGNTYRHGLPYQDREWALAGRRRGVRSGGGGTAAVKRCQCGALSPVAAPGCYTCKALFPAPPLPELKPSELQRIEATRKQIAAERERLTAFAAERKFKPGWVEKVLAAKFGAEAAA